MKKIIFQLVFLLPFYCGAQVVLSLQDVLDSALKNNYDIRIAGNLARVGEINNHLGMAGALPTIGINAADNESFTNVNQKLNSGTEIKRDLSRANVLTSGINGSITLFNGMKVVATKQKLNYLQSQGEQNLNAQIQNTLAAVMIKYYDIIRQQEYEKVIQQTLEVSQKKLEIVNERKKAGMASDADMLQAQIDVNTSSQNLLSQKLMVDQAKTDLLDLLGSRQYYTFTIQDSILVDKNLSPDSVFGFLIRNPLYLSAIQQVKISEQAAKEISAQRFPSMKLNAGYNFNLTKNEAGLTLFNQNYGPVVGVSLYVPIFNGNIYHIQHKSAKYNTQNAKFERDKLFNDLTATAVKTGLSYKTTLQQIEKQQDNKELSTRLVNLTLEKFRLNQSTILDMKTAQASYESNAYLLVNLQYAAKVSEIELKRLMFRLGERRKE